MSIFHNKIIITQTLFLNIMLVICWLEFVVIFGKWNKGKPAHKLEKTKITQGEFMQKLYTCILNLKQVLKAVRHLLEQTGFVERWHRHFTMKNEDKKKPPRYFLVNRSRYIVSSVWQTLNISSSSETISEVSSSSPFPSSSSHNISATEVNMIWSKWHRGQINEYSWVHLNSLCHSLSR